MADFSGTSAADTHIGDANNDLIVGLGGADLLDGAAGNDTIEGGDDHDTLTGGLGNDILDGGDGFDRVSYLTAAVGVTVNLEFQGPGETQNTGDGVDTLIGVEAVAGSAFNDTLTGDDGDNWLWSGSDGAGNVGNDAIDGGDGNDLIIVGGGDHDLQGGAGDFDTLSFRAAPLGDGVTVLDIDDSVYVSLAGDLWSAPQVTGQGHMYIRGFENLSGSSFKDVLEGDEDANVLAGWGGGDDLRGDAGDDLLLGDGLIDVDADGEITVYEEEAAGDDTLEGGEGNDTLNGGEGVDTAVYAGARGDYTISTDEDLTIADDGGAEGLDVLIGVELARFADAVVSLRDGALIATNDDDIWTGDPDGDDVFAGIDGNDSADGGGGADWLSGDDGDDTLVGGEGSDTLTGGWGNDTTSYAEATSGVTVDLDEGVGFGEGSGEDTLIQIEHVIGSAFDDEIVGHWDWNALSGGDGVDTLRGGNGEDTLFGGAGDDLLEGGVDNDRLEGGAGLDTATYGYAEVGVTADLSTGVALGDEYDQDELIDIENLTGSNHDDTLIGDAGDNVLAGQDGDDSLEGGAGDDTIDGGAGDDTAVFSGAIEDYTFAGDSGVVTVVHNDGGADGFDTLTGVEILKFSNGMLVLEFGIRTGTEEDDSWVGTDEAEAYAGLLGSDTMAGGGGGDWLMGNDGDDWLAGGSGANELEGGDGIDTADYSDAEAAMEIDLALLNASGGDRSDSLSSIENIVGSALADTIFGYVDDNSLSGGEGADIITGGDGTDTLRGGTGDDTLDGGSGADLLDGGEGADTAGYLDSSGGVEVDLAGDAEDTLISIENLIGSNYADTLTGDGGANVIEGVEGDDLLDGAGGNDVVSYAAAGQGVDVDLGLVGPQNVGAGLGLDTLVNFEGVVGSDYGDTLAGGTGSVTLSGGEGNDTFLVAPGAGETARIDMGDGADGLVLGAAAAGLTVVSDFDTEADWLDVEDLLDATDWDGVENPFEAGFLKLVQDGVDTLVQVDADGSGSGAAWTAVRLDGVNSLDLTVDHLGFEPLPEITGGAGDDEFTWTPDSSVTSIFGGGGFNIVSFIAGPIHAAIGLVSNMLSFVANTISVFFNSITDVFVRAFSLSIDGPLDGFGLSHDTIHYEGTAGDDNTLDASGMTSAHSIDAEGLDGEDTLISAGGNDRLDGGTGADSLSAGGDDDTLIGGAGNDELDGGAGSLDVAVFSGVRADYTVTSLGAGLVQVSGADGVDTLSGIERLRFDDTTTDGLGAAISSGGGGGDDEAAEGPTGGPDSLMLSAGADSVNAGGGDDTVLAGDGADFVHGALGDDSLLGGAGADTMHGGQGDDRVFGEAGDDVLSGDRGSNYLRGGEGNDVLFGGEAFDDLHGNVGDDVVRGGGGGDWVVGGQGRDTLYGEDGGDVVLGNLGDDAVDGGAGNDVARGGQGADLVLGGDGDDWLSGDRGADTLTGGAGADTFHSFAEAGADRVLDFDFAQGDRVNLLAGSTYTATQVGADVVVSIAGGGELTLVGVQLAGLGEGWITVG